jgi:type I restriction enzyme S subunit
VSGEQHWPIPAGWIWAEAGAIGMVDLGRQRSPVNHTGPDMRPYVRSANITWQGWDFSDVKAMNFNTSDFATFQLRYGDVLLNEGSGSASEVGKPAVWLEQIQDCCFQNTLLRFRSEVINPWYARAFFDFSARAGHLVSHTQGVNIFHIGKRGLESFHLPVPPVSEQHRIVAKIDQLSARVTRAREELEAVRILGIRAKRFVLKSAFAGSLTGDLRGSSSLVGWRTLQLHDIAEIQTGITLGKQRSKDEPLVERPYLRVANVQRGRIDLQDVKRIRITEKEYNRLRLCHGDILMNEGGDRDKLGRGWVWHGQIEDCVHQNHVFRVRLRDKFYPPELISLYANEFGQQHFLDQGKQTTNLASISKAKLATLPLILPPNNEAGELLRRIEHSFAAIDRLAAEARSARDALDKLDQAILAKAFRGELVPQDPNDEPASVLLERIRAERAAAGPAPKRGRRPRGAAA